ncbi:hypothetical protein AVEN_190064-1 [Araneus ventricosus]|uniref:Uncharacterized protein n=1 Tax=Araneus ventricosus TaxID=182803 RepID=A0A4Y2WX51_ARAVE|nr:hypothetical protein AVEN_190064-1 [Araneus ventricosus]
MEGNNVNNDFSFICGMVLKHLTVSVTVHIRLWLSTQGSAHIFEDASYFQEMWKLRISVTVSIAKSSGDSYGRTFNQLRKEDIDAGQIRK